MDKDKMTFESSLARLEEIVRILEGGTATLDDSLALFEEGVKLVKFCNEKLETAEQKVKMLVFDKDGNMTETDFA